MEFSKGVNVMLKRNNKDVAFGIIEAIGTRHLRKFSPLGKELASVQVLQVFDGNLQLSEDPFLDYLEEAVGAFINWPIRDLVKVDDSSCQQNHNPISSRNSSHVISKNNVFESMKVYLQHKKKNVAYGIIQIVDPKLSCRWSLLGPHKVGVLITKVFDGDVPLPHDPFLDFLEEAIHLTIAWHVQEIIEDTSVDIRTYINHPFSTNEMTFNCEIGRKVVLHHNKKIVANGIIEILGAEKICRFKRLGSGQVGVRIIEVFDGDIPLLEDPLLDVLDEAMNMIIIWSIDSMMEMDTEFLETSNQFTLEESKEEDYKKGFKVCLKKKGKIIGIGIFDGGFKSGSDHGSVIPEGMASILVIEVFDGKVRVLNDHTIDTLENAKGFYISWPLKDLTNLEDEESKALQYHDHIKNRLTTNPRSGWLHKKVLLMSKEKERIGTIIGEGFVSLVEIGDVVNFESLGESDLGITITALYQERSTYDSTISNDQVQLVRWPINLLQLHNGDPLAPMLQDSNVVNVVGSINSTLQPLDVPFLRAININGDILQDSTSKKRRYNMVNRIPSKRVRNLAKSNEKCSWENVLAVATVECCRRQCCQLTRRESVARARFLVWGGTCSNRMTLSYDKIGTLMEVKAPNLRKAKLIPLDGGLVCQKAWYTIHGISRATFFRYKCEQATGAVIARHGNTGSFRETKHVTMARQMIKRFIEDNAEKMPHKCRTTFEGERETQKVLPSMYRMKEIMEDCNFNLINSHGMPIISQPTFSRLMNRSFPEVTTAKYNQFSKCAECVRIKNARKCTIDPKERAMLKQEMRMHMAQQMSCRNLYYSWRDASKLEPTKYLCIIHDKMDQMKTNLPRLLNVPKSLTRTYRLPCSLTGMLTHGHGTGSYGHFALGFWSMDPNFTIGSLAQCLRDLEITKEYNSSSQCKGNQPLFDCLLDSFAFNMQRNYGNSKHLLLESSLNVCNPILLNKPLPQCLYLQLDNCAGENKNRYVFAFLSLLVAKGIFKQVYVGFLMVGHTHEDVDAMFSKFSESMRVKDAFTLPQMMDIFHNSYSRHPVPSLVEEVPDFKSFLQGYIPDKEEALCGHKNPLQFRFLMIDEFPVMQYRMNPSCDDWKPTLGIKMWKSDNITGKPLLPQGEPKPVPLYSFLQDNDMVSKGIQDYVKRWEEDQRISMLQGNESYSTWLEPTIAYWRKVLDLLNEPRPQYTSLQNGFWPQTRWMEHAKENFMESTNSNPEPVVLQDHYCGPRNARSRTSFEPLHHVKKGMLLLIRPDDEDTYPIWMGEALEEIDMNPNNDNYKKVHVNWWVPVGRGNLDEKMLYENCWESNWKPNPRDPPRWEDVDTIVHGWKPKKDARTMKRAKIPTWILDIVRHQG